MTLLIALLLMDLANITNPGAYIGVTVLWLLHVAYHSDRNSNKCRFK